MQIRRRRPGWGTAGALTVLWSLSLALVGELGGSRMVSADADVNLVPIVPARLADTRTEPGLTTIDGQSLGTGPIASQGSIEIQVAGRGGVDPRAESVMLNVTAVNPVGQGYLTVWPCDEVRPFASHVNYSAGEVAPNAVLAKLAADGSVCVFAKTGTDVIVDVTGYVPEGGAPVSVLPARLAETRTGPNDVTVDGLYEGLGRRAAGGEIQFKVTGRGGVPAGAEAVYLNVTAIRPDGSGFLTVYPCGSARPGTSNVNYTSGDISPNAVLATVGVDGMVCIFTKSAADIIADVNGYLPSGGNRIAINPARCADTRPDGVTFDGLFRGDGKIAAGGVYAIRIAGRCNIPPGASAAYFNVTAVDPDDRGFLTVWPCDAERPTTSNVNYLAGQTQPNAVLSKISLDDDGQVCVFSKASTHVVVDVNGYVPAPGLYGIAQVAAGGRHTCVLMGDDTVRCAGQEGYLGDGTKGEDYPLVGGTYQPLLVPGLGPVEFVEAGYSQTCAVLRSDGSARCWGQNNYGQLGDGTTVGTGGDSFDRRLSPVDVQGLDGIVDLSMWENHTCALVDDDGDGTGDSVSCWGFNNRGQLGSNPGTDSAVPVAVPGLPNDRTPVDVEVGSSHTCLLFDDGTVSCWGLGGRVGRTLGSSSEPPTLVPGIEDAVALSVGRNHTCVIREGGTPSCWGLDNAEALGPRAAVDDRLPSDVIGVTGAVEIEAGYETTCVRAADGTARCWGANTYGQLGDGSPAAEEPAPVTMQPGSGRTIAAVSSNGLFSCALQDDASVVCWGYYNDGNLGVAIPNHTATPVLYGSGDLRP